MAGETVWRFSPAMLIFLVTICYELLKVAD